MAYRQRNLTQTVQRQSGIDCVLPMCEAYMTPNEMIHGHEFYCIGGVTIHGVIGTKDYAHATYEQARAKYLQSVKFNDNERLLDEHIKNATGN